MNSINTDGSLKELNRLGSQTNSKSTITNQGKKPIKINLLTVLISNILRKNIRICKKLL